MFKILDKWLKKQKVKQKQKTKNKKQTHSINI